MAEFSSAAQKPYETRRRSLDAPPLSLSNELQCSICLDLFTDPVSTPCGHNFCKNCLNQCWNNSQTYNCPFCKETFSKRPDLKINTALRQVVQHIKEKSGLSKSEVLCDFCDDIKMKALKMCLVCQSSYCETHLEPHQRVAHLKKHKLIDPEANLEDYICQKHEKPLELFCRDDQTCVCLLCAMKDHKNHNTVAVEEECGEREPQLMKMQTEVRQMIQNRIKRIQDIRHLKEVKNESSEKEKADSTELFTDLMRSIERCQSELLEMMEQKQKAAGKQAELMIKELEQEITELKRRDTELEQLSHTEDHLHLLQIYPSLIRPKFTSSWSEISISDTQLSVETLRKALIQLQETLDEKLSKSVQKTMQHAGTKASDAESVPKTMQLYGDTVSGGQRVCLRLFSLQLCLTGELAFLSLLAVESYHGNRGHVISCWRGEDLSDTFSVSRQLYQRKVQHLRQIAVESYHGNRGHVISCWRGEDASDTFSVSRQLYQRKVQQLRQIVCLFLIRSWRPWRSRSVTSWRCRLN